MENVVRVNDCRQCRKARKPVQSKYWLAGIVMVILPKCPFCVFAYSSTIMLCGRDTVISKTSIHFSQATVLFTGILCFFTLAGIAFNWRDRRTVYALGLALSGSMMAITSVLYGGGEYLYYSGVLLMFAGVWLNGSLMHVINKVKNKITSPINKITRCYHHLDEVSKINV